MNAFVEHFRRFTGLFSPLPTHASMDEDDRRANSVATRLVPPSISAEVPIDDEDFQAAMQNMKRPVPPSRELSLYGVTSEEQAKRRILAENRHSMAVQIGGNHYRKMPMQPFEFTLRNAWDGAAHSILKYVSRHHEKGGAEDLKKARHIVDIRVDFMPQMYFTPGVYVPVPWDMDPPSIDRFIEGNRIKPPEASVLHELCRWVYSPDLMNSSPVAGEKAQPAPEALKDRITALIYLRYGVTADED